jgi:hypothetical protein
LQCWPSYIVLRPDYSPSGQSKRALAIIEELGRHSSFYPAGLAQPYPAGPVVLLTLLCWSLLPRLGRSTSFPGWAESSFPSWADISSHRLGRSLFPWLGRHSPPGRAATSFIGPGHLLQQAAGIQAPGRSPMGQIASLLAGTAKDGVDHASAQEADIPSNHAPRPTSVSAQSSRPD